MYIKITSLFHSKLERNHSRNMRNKREKCMFPKVSHFVFESFIYIMSLSGLIKGTANYTYQSFFRLQRSTMFSCFTCECLCWRFVSISALFSSFASLWKDSVLKEKHFSSWTNSKGKNNNPILSIPQDSWACLSLWHPEGQCRARALWQLVCSALIQGSHCCRAQ